MTFTAIFPESGLGNGRLTVRIAGPVTSRNGISEWIRYKQLHAASSLSARKARFSLPYGSSAMLGRAQL